MKMSVPWRLTVIWAPALLVLLFGVLVFNGLRNGRRNAEAITRSYSVVAMLERVVGHLKDAETAARGFYVTGDTTFLLPYREAPAAIEGTLDSLRALVVDSVQRQRVEALSAAVASRYGVIAENVAARRTRELTPDEVSTRMAIGNRIMAESESLSSMMRSAQQSLLRRQLLEERDHARRIAVLILLGTALAVFFSVLVNAIVARYARAEEVAVEEIEQRNALLQEQAVELEAQVEELQNQASELEETQAELEDALQDLQRANVEVARSEKRFRSLVEHASEMITVADRTGHVVYDSPAVERVLGYSSQELEGRSVFDFIHADDVQRVRTAYAQLLRTKEAVQAEFRARHKDGSIRILSATAVNLLDDPAVGGVVANVLDLTELRESEDRFRHAQKMEAVGRLAGGIAHDFNNLLMVIQGSAEVALLELPGSAPVRSDLLEIQAAAERATNLTRQLLAFSRQQVVEPKIVNVNDVVRDLERMLRRTLGEDVGVVTHLASEIGTVSIDTGQLEQILMNLAVNARDAMPDGGRLIIETSNAEISESPQERSDDDIRAGSYVLLMVSDTGTGMSRRVRERAFEPFFTTKPKGKGTGLGLSTVYGIVRQAGGHIWVYSEPEHGSTFKIYLPRADERAPKQVRPLARASVDGSAVSILLVEDEPAVRTVTSRMLRKMGHQVIEAGTAEDAIKIAEGIEEPLDLVLTDVVLPQMAGPQLVDNLRSRWPEIRVVYASGYTDETVVRYGILNDGAAFLQKPFDYDGLAAKIRQALTA